MIQEMGPGKIKVRVTVTSEVIIDEDDLERMRNQGWDDTLRHLHLEGIPIYQVVDQVETYQAPVKKKAKFKRKPVAVK